MDDQFFKEIEVGDFIICSCKGCKNTRLYTHGPVEVKEKNAVCIKCYDPGFYGGGLITLQPSIHPNMVNIDKETESFDIEL